MATADDDYIYLSIHGNSLSKGARKEFDQDLHLDSSFSGFAKSNITPLYSGLEPR